MKADLSIPKCMRVHHLRRIYVVHWSGGCKPAVLEPSDAADQHEEAALLSYKEAYRNLTSWERWDNGLLLSAASERHIEGQPRQHPLGGGTACWFRRAPPIAYHGGRRCGTCCGAKGDNSSAMCIGSRQDGTLVNVGEDEVRARCAGDEGCAGFYVERAASRGPIFRPVTATVFPETREERSRLRRKWQRFCDGWEVFRKACRSD